MAFELGFSDRYVYDSIDEGVTVPTVLTVNGARVELLAKIDTGASACLFQREYAETLGLELENGAKKTFGTVKGPFTAYGHEVSVQVRGIEIRSIVYFFADPGISRNVLGRCGWLDRIRLGLVDYETTVYLAAHGEETL